MRIGGDAARAPRRPTALSPALLTGLAAGLLDSNFVLAWLLPGVSGALGTVVSDLAADGRAWNWAFRTADSLSAALLVALAVAAWRSTPGRPRPTAWRLATALLAAYAVSTLAAVLVPESGSQPAGPTSWTDLLHDVVSTLGTACGIFSALAFAVALGPGTRAGRAHLAAFLGAGLLGLTFLLTQQLGCHPLLGSAQRLQILVLSSWMVLVGSAVGRPGARPAPPGRPPPASPGRTRPGSMST